MKHLKNFEYMHRVGDIKIGEYVLLDIDYKYADNKPESIKMKFFMFTNNNIGRVTQILEKTVYTIQYENVPSIIGYIFDINNAIDRHISEIKYHAKTKEEVEAMIASEKYNL